MDIKDELRTIREKLRDIQTRLDQRRPDMVLLDNNPGGIWAWLATSQSVTAASGTTKGTGTVTLFGDDGVTLKTGANSTVPVKNAGGAVAGNANGGAGYLVKLGRMPGGEWSLDVAPCDAAVS